MPTRYSLRGGRVVRTRVPPALVPNRPTPEGRAMGLQLARLADEEEPKHRERFPGAPERCKSCAFRAGTVPNGCPETVMDAMKCLLEQEPFHCHEGMEGGKPTRLCAGWQILFRPELPPGEMPWAYSTERNGGEG